MRSNCWYALIALSFRLLSQEALGQDVKPVEPVAKRVTGMAQDVKAISKIVTPEPTAAYLLHADDEFAVRSLEAKEIDDKTFRIDQGGDANFPLIGILHLGGLSVRDAELKLRTAFQKFYKAPDIAITITTFHTESVSVLGSVGSPGVYQLKGEVHLLDALSAAGGVRGEAGETAIVTRQSASGPIPLPEARQKVSGEYTVEINLKSLMNADNSKLNIVMEPHDTVMIPAAELVYVLGSVKRAGGFALGGRPNLTVLQALALAEGLDLRASPRRAEVLRRGGEKEQQIPVNVDAILKGKDEDLVLHPNDILYVPTSAMKTVTTRTIEAAIQVGTGLAIYAH